MEHNENHHVSYLPQPSRVTSPGRLAEMPASATNARNTAMMPPPTGPVSKKHYLPSQTEPAPKRKTLAETAGEFKNKPAAPPSSRTVNSAVKATVQAGLSRNTSFSTSSSRTTSASSRQTSNTSFSSSVGSGLRPPSVQALTRPTTSSSNPRVASRTLNRRPATALGNRDGGLPKNGNGTDTISLKTPSQKVHNPRKRGPSTRSDYSTGARPNSFSSVTSRSNVAKGSRMSSLSLKMGALTLTNTSSAETTVKDDPLSPSKIPRPVTPAPSHSVPPSPCPHRTPRSGKGSPSKIQSFLTKNSSIRQDWEPQGFLQDFERTFSDTMTKMNNNMAESAGMKEVIGVYKSTSMSLSQLRAAIQEEMPPRKTPQDPKLAHMFLTLVNELEKVRSQLTEENGDLRTEIDTMRYRLTDAERALQESTRDHEIEVDDLSRQHRIEVEDFRLVARKEQESIRDEHQERHREIRRRLEEEIDSERSQRIQALSQVSTQGEMEKQKVQRELEDKDREVQNLRQDVEDLKGTIERELSINTDLRKDLVKSSSTNNAMESSNHALQAKIEYLESDSKSQSEAYATMERQMREAIDRAQELQDKLRAEETVRRKLHNQVQELKGNIRVFCRVRPLLSSDAPDSQARLSFPDACGDAKDIDVRGPEEKSSLGNDMTRTNNFSFDRVFGPGTQNGAVFDEISQLVQSALDGYNVCIFCYGQTGSGKTYTMSSADGMIPRAVGMIYEQAKALEERGWTYHMEGSFVEVYNENLNDLLGDPEDLDRKKHEIRHELAQAKTTVSDVQTVVLDSPDTVVRMLDRAMANRSVAATKSNERSSRSHSVFMLRLAGKNSVTGESCDATLNLVDLAGSERLNASRAEGARLKETQSINRSLSCLGDVIGALGRGEGGKAHVPYRNSKLTYLLQMSLSGHSKTLMFVMVSPLKDHLKETIASLRFATTVNSTHVGVARRGLKG